MKAAPQEPPALPDEVQVQDLPSAAGSRGNWVRKTPVARFAGIAAKVTIALAVVVGILYNLVGFPRLREVGVKYRLDLDVYRLGGTLFREGTTLYGSMPPTSIGKQLPFTYPPLSAMLFSPLSFVSLDTAALIVTALSVLALVATAWLTLRSLGFCTRETLLWGSLAVLAIAFALEPVYSTFDYGQINIILMALVSIDILAKKPWLPRGILIGLAAAIKLTPAVFVLFFLVRKDFRAAVITGVGFLVASGIAFVASFGDSAKYWTVVLANSSRIGNPGYPANQSVTGMLTRLGVDESVRALIWLGLIVAFASVIAYAMWRALLAGEPAIALGLNALLGLAASPVSWSHHWVWTVPLLLALAVAAYRRRSIALGGLTTAGLLILYLAPHWELGASRWSGLGWPLRDQVLASSYVWWALAVAVACAIVFTHSTVSSPPKRQPVATQDA